jgi:phosphate transport system substrate-binding protein
MLEIRHFLARLLLKQIVLAALISLLSLGLVACRPAISPDSLLGSRVSLIGAGASFPALLYQSWAIALYQVMPELRVNYQALGSGAGVEQLIDHTIDFGASDVAMTDDELAQVDSRGALLLPMTAGSVVLAYNLPPLAAPLHLSRQSYSEIFLGQVTTWNDPKIVADNPGLTLPNLPITVVHRSDGSGTTAVLTSHLSQISRRWKAQVGAGKSVDWPDGRFIGGKGNEGVTVQIRQAPGAIGYIEYSYAVNNHLPMAALENQAGQFIMPTDASATAALVSVKLPANLRAFITDPAGQDAYPIVTYTWLLAYQHYADPLKAKAVELFIDYGLNQGQDVAAALGYVPLPPIVRRRVATVADGISADYTIAVK